MTDVYRFAHCELRPGTRELTVDGAPAALGTRAFDLLLALVERRERLVAKSELFDLVWPGLVVEENNLQVQISTLRKVLGPAAILTVPGRGYRFLLAGNGEDPGTAHPTTNVASAVTPPENVTAPRLTNLPVAETLLGRDEDTAALTQLMAGNRLVTVLGAGGIGKTRLAQAVARRLVGAYAQGVWWVDLAALSSPEQVVPAIAATAGVRLGEGDALIPLEQALAPRNTLLVLDNCEHLVGKVAELVQAILANAADVRVLATSQESLNAPGEHVYRLDTLRVPPAGTRLEAARGFSALQLLEKRAQAVHQNFWLTESTIANAIELCRQLDGIALAIEMAAARLPVLGSETLLARLDDRLRLLRSSTRGAPARHQTLRATLDWSHSLLTADEQAVLRRLSVFAGSFPLGLVQRVTTTPDLDEWSALDALTGLADKSLIRTDQHEPPRYRLLETTRLYALERLAECGETAATMERHGQVMRTIAANAVQEFWTTPDRAWLERYASAYHDLEIAFLRASERGDAAVVAATGEALDFLDQLRSVALRAQSRQQAAYALIVTAPLPVQAQLWSLVSRPRGGAIEAVSRLNAARESVAAWGKLDDRPALYRAWCALAIESARARLRCGHIVAR
ncbi:MAG: winged helix-turn-helix domain-containing protein [Betaproteobacteria bacterium]